VKQLAERDKSILTRMSEDELNKYRKLVKKSKLKQQDYNLKCLLNKNIIFVDGLIDLAFQIRKIGVNINQIVYLY
jgi:hypothetical protein